MSEQGVDFQDKQEEGTASCPHWHQCLSGLLTLAAILAAFLAAHLEDRGGFFGKPEGLEKFLPSCTGSSELLCAGSGCCASGLRGGRPKG